MKVDICDFVTIERTIDLPDSCPECNANFVGKGSKLIAWSRDERAFSAFIVRDDNQLGNGVEFDKYLRSGDLSHSTGYACQECDHVLFDSHERLYELEEMGKTMAFKLRGLLYDANVLDEDIKKKVFDELNGYHAYCMACNFEAEIGTEEVPHPVDPRAHTCQRTA